MKASKLLLLFSVFIISCSKSDDDAPLPPTLITTAISGVANTIAVSGGTITSDNGSAVTARGVVWETTENPTIANSKTTDGTGTGNFTSNITGLTANTTYYLRAYATNSGGTAYGNQLSFTTTNVPASGTSIEYIIDITNDRDGNIAVHSSGSSSCMYADGALFDMDSYAISYSVKFYDMVRATSTSTTYPADVTYNFNADASIDILNGVKGNYTYTNWYNASLGAVTRFPSQNKLFVMIGWCTTSDCIDNCYLITGKAKITVHY